MMWIARNRNKRSGFTLIELAIVLAVASVLFVGLYRLLSGGNQQVKDSAVASQQAQLISAVKGFLSSGNGQTYMGFYTRVGAVNDFPLPLPTITTYGVNNAACRADLDAQDTTLTHTLQFLCDYLPNGFSGALSATPTLNAYGQSFVVRGQTAAVQALKTAPPTYAFMVLTVGGPPAADLIPDASGGRISSQIGSDGGFIYQNAAICGLNSACGSYGAWTVPAATLTAVGNGFGFAAAQVTFGHVASRTYVSGNFDSAVPWLSRLNLPNDTLVSATASPSYNTMQYDLFLGSRDIYMAGNNNLGAVVPPATPGGSIYLQNANIVDTAIPNANQVFGSIQLAVPGPYSYPAGATYASGGPLVLLQSGCSTDDSTAKAMGIHHTATDTVGTPGNDCKEAIRVVGDVNVRGLLQAASLFSHTFIYQSSDARLKTDIVPIQHPLETLMQMNPVSFTFKANGQKGLGFIAQDVEKIYPQLVTPNGDQQGMKAVNYEGLIAPLVGAVQELKQQNDDLRRQLHDQTLRQEEFEKKLGRKAQ